MKYLFVGDVHAVPDELEDCKALMEGVEKTAIEHKVDRIVLMGDQHHTHAVLRLEVMHFWKEQFQYYLKNVIALSGNHDQPGNGNTDMSAMDFYPQIDVPKPAYLTEDRVLFISYISSEEQFQHILHAHHGEFDTLVCHQTFQGAQYENGFFAKDGFTAPYCKRAFVGHIHTPTTLGPNIHYIGAPRWRTLADANVERSIVVWDSADPDKTIKVPTKQWCTPIYAFKDTEAEPVEPVEGKRIYVDIYGSESWVNSRIPMWGKARIRTFVDKTQVHDAKESDGLAKAFGTYVQGFKPPNNSSIDALTQMAKERLHGVI